MLNPNSTIEVLNVQNIAIFSNPIQTTFTIQYDLLAAANVNIDILDVNGRVVTSIINEKQTAGEYLLKVNQSDKLNKGIYFVRLRIDGKSTVTKLVKL